MTLHPLTWTIFAMDAACLLLMASAAYKAFRFALNWRPESGDRRQIRLEIDAEKSFIEARWCFVLWISSTVVLIAGIACVFPEIVPGAMCGTGVIQAMGGIGGRAIFFRLAFSGIMFLFYQVERLNRTRPDSPLAPGISRLLLLGAPVLLMAVRDTFRAFYRIDIQAPVNCCTVVYDRFLSVADAGAAAGIPESYWTIGLGAASALLLISAARVWKAGSGNFRKKPAMTAISSMLFVPVAAVALVRVFAAYYYEVLHHHCPWCLFLPEHHGAGFALFGLLTVVSLEGLSGFVIFSMAGGIPDLHASAVRRVRKSGFLILVSASLFLLLVGLPPLLWRLRFGVFMG